MYIFFISDTLNITIINMVEWNNEMRGIFSKKSFYENCAIHDFFFPKY